LSEALSFPRSVGDGLLLRAVQTDAEAEKVIALNAEIHGPDEGEVVRHWLFHGHPTMSRGDWLFIEDQATGEAAASLSLMPTPWRYDSQPLPVAELGFVGTRAAYRRRGLQRVLSDTFDQLAQSRGFTLAAIEGIPGFYGQFGYDYAVPLLGGVDLEYAQIPASPSAGDPDGESDNVGYVTRAATMKDLPALRRLYDASIADLNVAAPRDRELWAYQLSAPEPVTFYPPTTVLERDGRVMGYLRWNDDGWTDRIRIVELGVEDGPGARKRILVALRFVRDRGQSANKRGVTLQLPENHPAVSVGRYLGAIDHGYYGWQMKVLDPISFMRAIGPALEGRLAGSLLAGFSGELVFVLYGYPSRLALRFHEGRLVEVTTADRETEAHARMTLKQATQLWLGWRGREALEKWNPDFSSGATSRQLIDVLFPKAHAYIYMPY
jgi:GNAT superfamily N-acetyltransferase